MASPRATFITDCQTGIVQVLQFADNWSALKAEFDTFAANGIAITQGDLDAVFGAGRITVAQFNETLAAMQTAVDFIHAPAQAPKLYRVKR
jgi:hypothetical protein